MNFCFQIYAFFCCLHNFCSVYFSLNMKNVSLWSFFFQFYFFGIIYNISGTNFTNCIDNQWCPYHLIKCILRNQPFSLCVYSIFVWISFYEFMPFFSPNTFTGIIFKPIESDNFTNWLEIFCMQMFHLYNANYYWIL